MNLRSHCEVGERLGQRLRLPTRACEGLWFVFERWDGKGMRAGVRGTRIPIAARVLHAARDAAAFARLRDGKVDYFRGSEDTAVTAQAFAAG